jgi:hypothetical protein
VSGMDAVYASRSGAVTPARPRRSVHDGDSLGFRPALAAASLGTNSPAVGGVPAWAGGQTQAHNGWLAQLR